MKRCSEAGWINLAVVIAPRRGSSVRATLAASATQLGASG